MTPNGKGTLARLMVATACILGCSSSVPPPPRVVSGAESRAHKTIRIIARKFEFEPATIALRVGQTSLLEITSEDRLHGFRAPGLGIDADIEPGKTVRITVTPQKPGTYPFVCHVFCGDGHESMVGEFIVTP